MELKNKIKWGLIGGLIVIFIILVISFFIPAMLNRALHFLADNEFTHRMQTLSESRLVGDSSLVEMDVVTVVLSEIDYQPVVILKEKEGDLYLPVLIGLNEAVSISAILAGEKPPRPLTHDLLCGMMNSLGASIDRVIITEIKDNIYYARIVFYANWTHMEMDSRPSDAIALALRLMSPIYSTREVLDASGIRLENKTW